MAGASAKPNPKTRKRVDADTGSLKRARDGSAFMKCEACKKDVAVALVDMHSCSLDAKIKMTFESQIEERVTEIKKPVEKSKSSGDEFRKTFKEENPEEAKSVSKVAKEGGEKWKSLSDEEKKPYLEKAAELKAEYEKAMEKFNDSSKEANEEEEGSVNEEE
ncbi:high mobility group B protein 7 isoform X2 [Amborella trichopoda]|uniref:high mobility group B protein 7 isoform X2 n=1 Tax=Amborella trichopoda TaxID=13333 RepID=UPI0009C071D8|nr:high mobility group B protein 7 isoform X2 [Amborella trichopoda]|eukprot:XP_020525648.1 high mobility group B protein 7 isoform X2 [Amborella trichopoda]